jgi:hypothetical protein
MNRMLGPSAAAAVASRVRERKRCLRYMMVSCEADLWL